MSCVKHDFFVKFLAISPSLWYNTNVAASAAVQGGIIMRYYMLAYEAFLRGFLESPVPEQVARVRRETLTQIRFMQHERFVHFLVCILVGLAFFIALGLALYFRTVGLFLLAVILLGLLAPYLWHYYFLENTTQKMYVLYNRLSSLEDGISYPNTSDKKLMKL